jgi:hypothetical protein
MQVNLSLASIDGYKTYLALAFGALIIAANHFGLLPDDMGKALNFDPNNWINDEYKLLLGATGRSALTKIERAIVGQMFAPAGAPEYGGDGAVKTGAPLRALAWLMLPAALLASLLLAPSAQAQTATKAPPPAASTSAVANCSGPFCIAPYLGGGISESGGNFNVAATGINGVASNNLNMMIEGGIDYFSSNLYVGLTAVGEYGITANGNIPGGGNSALWGAGQWARLGYNVANALGIAPPTGNAPSLAGVVTTTVPYINIGVWERPWGSGFLSGVGVVGWLSKTVTVHVDFNHVNFNNASINAIAKQQTEDMVLGGFDYHFAF